MTRGPTEPVSTSTPPTPAAATKTKTKTITSTATAAFETFIHACRSPETRTVYTMGLHYFMDYLKLDRSSYDKLLPPEKDPRSIQMDIRDYVTYLRQQQKLSYASISTYVAALSKFYAKNFVTLNTKDIKDYMGEHERVAEDRPYTHSEIQTLVNNTNKRNKAIILLMCSSGARLGAIPLLRIRDLTPIDQYNIYKIHFYAKAKKGDYHGYCTPESRKALDDYFEYRKRWGERITDDSPLFRVDYNAMIVKQQQPGKKEVQPISKHCIRNFMSLLLLHTGLRKVPTENQTKRLDTMMTHGFRKFFETNAFRAGMDHMYLRRLMGQKSGLEDAYLKLSEQELLEGDSRHVGFVGIIDQLTINEENRLKRKLKELTIKADKVDELSAEFAAFKQKLGL